MNLHSTRIQPWGKLTSLRIDIEQLQIAGNDPKALSRCKLEALQVAVALKAECSKVLQ